MHGCGWYIGCVESENVGRGFGKVGVRMVESFEECNGGVLKLKEGRKRLLWVGNAPMRV